MRLRLIAGLIVISISGCASMKEVLEASPLGSLAVTSSDPKDYPSEFITPPKIENDFKSESIYGYQVGTKLSKKGRFNKKGAINGGILFELKDSFLPKKGPISNKVESIYLLVNPNTNIIRSITVDYGSPGDVDSKYVRDKIRKYTLGGAEKKYYFEEGEYIKNNRRRVNDYTSCSKKRNLADINPGGAAIAQMHSGGSSFYQPAAKDAIECADADATIYRLKNNLPYSFSSINRRILLTVGQMPEKHGLTEMINSVLELNKTDLKLIFGKSNRKPKRQRVVDDQGNVSYLNEYLWGEYKDYNIGLNLLASLKQLNSKEIKGKSKVVSFTLDFTNNLKYGRAYSSRHVVATHFLYENTYMDARKYYSASLPNFLGKELGCKFKPALLPSNFNPKKGYKKSEVCDTQKAKYTLIVDEDAVSEKRKWKMEKQSHFELAVSLKVELKQ